MYHTHGAFYEDFTYNNCVDTNLSIKITCKLFRTH